MGKGYNHNYMIYKTFDINVIAEQIQKNELPEKLVYHKNDYSDSLRRMKILDALIKRDGNRCVHCGKIPTHYAMGKDFSNRWHLDLYKDDDDDLLMFTIDHIHPKSKGGQDDISNYQMLCKKCNEYKGDTVEGEPKKPKSRVKKIKGKYLSKKLESLSEQIKGMLNKLTVNKIVCAKKTKGFTIGNTYTIEYIKTNINSNYDTTYTLFLLNDNNEMVETGIDNFQTVNDYYNLKN
jgi:5-methylcytosine-specific restriction endonuclease McrA